MMNMRSTVMSLLVGTMMFASLPANAQDTALQALDDALPGELLHNPFDLKWETKGNDIRAKMVDAEALTSGNAISVRIRKKQQRPWDSSLSAEIPGPVSKGEEIQVYFHARTKKPAAGKDTANVIMFVGRNEEPYDYILSEDILPGTEWELMNITGVANADYPADSLKVEYQLGRAAQTVEFGHVYVSSLGPKDSS
jgi:hypothetical protein